MMAKMKGQLVSRGPLTARTSNGWRPRCMMARFEPGLSKITSTRIPLELFLNQFALPSIVNTQWTSSLVSSRRPIYISIRACFKLPTKSAFWVLGEKECVDQPPSGCVTMNYDSNDHWSLLPPLSEDQQTLELLEPRPDTNYSQRVEYHYRVINLFWSRLSSYFLGGSRA